MARRVPPPKPDAGLVKSSVTRRKRRGRAGAEQAHLVHDGLGIGAPDEPLRSMLET